MARFTAVVTAVIGVVLLAGTLALGLIPAAAAGQRLIEEARPTVLGDGAAQLQRDAQALFSATDQTFDEAFPQIADALGLSPAGFDALLSQRYPAIAGYVERRDEVHAAVARTAQNLQERQADFAAASDYPTPGWPRWCCRSPLSCSAPCWSGPARCSGGAAAGRRRPSSPSSGWCCWSAASGCGFPTRRPRPSG